MSDDKKHSMGWAKKQGRDLVQKHLGHPSTQRHGFLRSTPTSLLFLLAGHVHMGILYWLARPHRAIWWRNINSHLLI